MIRRDYGVDMKKNSVNCGNFMLSLKNKLISMSKESKIYFIGCAVLLIGAFLGTLLFDIGEDNETYNLMFFGVMLVWCINIAFCFFNIKNY